VLFNFSLTEKTFWWFVDFKCKELYHFWYCTRWTDNRDCGKMWWYYLSSFIYYPFTV